MLGITHALIAATGNLAVCAATTYAGHPPTARTFIVGTIVSAGTAYLPDLDQPPTTNRTGSTAARLLGPLTHALSTAVAAFSRAVYHHTRTPTDRAHVDGHRTLTHTIPAALTAGLITALASALAGKTTALTAIFLSTALITRSLLSHRGTIPALLIAALATALAHSTIGPHGWAWLALPVTWGWLSHTLADALTPAGTPLLWPLPRHGRRWHPITAPHTLTCGSTTERHLITPTLTILNAALTYYIY